MTVTYKLCRKGKLKYSLIIVSPWYLQMVQLHSRTQVVDLQVEEIKYTPKDGDTITRTLTTNNTDAQTTTTTTTTTATETVQIPSGTGRTETLDLQMSDRIVNENKKIKFRVTSASQRMCIMSVPSVVSVYNAEDGRMKRLHKLTTYR